MSSFNYSDYQNVINRAQTGSTNSVRVGFFKLADNGDEALVRINVSSLDDLSFATVHQLGASTKWMKVSCTNKIGSYSDNCPFCRAVAAGNTAIGKSVKRVYIPMMVSYKDKVTGQWSAATPAVWERPAGFYNEIANKLRDFGDLKKVMLKITRNGMAGDQHTTYSMDYAIPAKYDAAIVPEDFSAFTNFKVNKHSYWEKSVEEIETFLRTGKFPEVATSNAAPAATTTPTQATYTAPTAQYTPAAPATPVTPATAAPTGSDTPWATTTTTTTATSATISPDNATGVSPDFSKFTF